MYANVVCCFVPFLHHKVIIGGRCVDAFSLPQSDSKGNNSGLKNSPTQERNDAPLRPQALSVLGAEQVAYRRFIRAS